MSSNAVKNKDQLSTQAFKEKRQQAITWNINRPSSSIYLYKWTYFQITEIM